MGKGGAMTNKEASGILKTEAISHIIPEVREALLMGAYELEQEPCGDAVSRQQAISAIRNLYPGIPFVKTELNLKKWQEKNKKYFECANIIKALPSVTPTRKKGKWIFEKTIFDKHGVTVKCSCCGKRWKTYDEIRWKKEKKYCENCGAEMRESEGEEDGNN